LSACGWLGKAVSCGKQRATDPGRRDGADDEGTRGDSEGGRREAEVVGRGRGYGRDGWYDAALAGAAGRARLPRSMGLPQAESQSQAGADAKGGAGIAAVPGAVLRLQGAAFS